jgi:NAD(P)-dependent dehydrogenase (short-subunit alcohol dehydrogenase family)
MGVVDPQNRSTVILTPDGGAAGLRKPPPGGARSMRHGSARPCRCSNDPRRPTMFEASLMSGQRILVTGGGTGLGRAMAEHFLSLGADIAICGRRKQVCDETAAEWREQFPERRVDTFGVDIRVAQAVDEMVQTLWDSGGLTGLVNNAAGNFIAPTESLSPRAFDAIANIVFHGTFYVTQAVGKRWIAQAKDGKWQPDRPFRSVMSIITTWVDNGSPYVVPSAMSKAGIEVMTKSLAVEWARHGIRLNAVGPGEIPTEGMSKRLNPGEEPGARSKARNPMGRAGKMAELQNLAAFLMAPGQCDWLTGQSLMMDGGNALATGGNFYELREWSDADWQAARERIEAQNAKDRAQR